MNFETRQIFVDISIKPIKYFVFSKINVLNVNMYKKDIQLNTQFLKKFRRQSRDVFYMSIRYIPVNSK